ncbi:MAG: hypothetical protein BVN35_09020 [Proteobacteria bacterium ST_bin11]|jgi:sec-independent protein translocase protein TatA|nr:MAG: hypothetical protein BVN35_09020 [Proteobacteria bacterium ST_bin11]
MGLGVSELLLILAIVVMIFGTKKLKNVGGDLGGAIRSFKQSMSEADQDEAALANRSQTAATETRVADSVESKS